MSSDNQNLVTGQSSSLISAGVLLSNERIKRGISIQQAADYLKLSRKQIEALENDDYANLPGATFVRGFVRNYAKYLELDPAPLMAWMDIHVPSAIQHEGHAHLVNASASERSTTPTSGHSSTVSTSSASESSTQETSGGSRVWWLLLFAALAGGAYFGVTHMGLDTDMMSAQKPVAPAEEAAAPPPKVEALQPSASTRQAAMPQTTDSASPEPSTQSSQMTTSSTPEAKTDAAQSESQTTLVIPEGSHLLKIVPKQESWMEVQDSTGKRLVYGNQAAGATREVVGRPPFKLTIGNAANVELIQNGVAVDLKPHVRGTIARFELK